MQIVNLPLCVDTTALLSRQVIKKSCYPRWNETFEFDLEAPSLEKLCTVEVWDWDLVSRNDFLGKVRKRGTPKMDIKFFPGSIEPPDSEAMHLLNSTAKKGH